MKFWGTEVQIKAGIATRGYGKGRNKRRIRKEWKKEGEGKEKHFQG